MPVKYCLLIGALFTCLSAFSQTNPANRVYEIWDDQPAPNRGSDASVKKAGGYPFDDDWEKHSYPIGNGYMGANIFGRTDLERIQVTEKTLANEGLYGLGGLTSFAEIYLETRHNQPQNYRRALNLNEGILYVNYEQDGVQYFREYLANYAENVIAIKLSANQKRKLSFVVRGAIPYLRSEKEANTRTGTSRADKDLITMKGNVAHFNVNYEAQIKVINEGGKLTASNRDGQAEIKVENATSVVLLITADTNYELTPQVFLEKEPGKKLNGNIDPHEQVSNRIARASRLGYASLRANHFNDYQNLFQRVQLTLISEIPKVPTRVLLENYIQGSGGEMLEELMFHFGRYMLIASSRAGAMPTGLQGVWSQYEVTPWTGGYWHNINVQMNYWGAFTANLQETFTPYLEYYQAYRPQAEKYATEYIRVNNPQALEENGRNGWTIGTGATAYKTSGPGGHSGPGTGGFTTKLLWDRYEFTNDTVYLREIGYPALLEMSRFLSKTLKPAGDSLLLVEPSASPEIRILDSDGNSGGYYVTQGTTFDQGFVWETYHDLLKAAEILQAEDEFLDVVSAQINKLDPIIIGASGQVKEFREENYYGEIGDPKHRHVSHLCPLYPGTLINSTTPEWVKGVSVALDLRGNQTTGWAMAHRMNLRARTKEAEKAYEVYAKFLKERTCPNLWTVHPPFQIDGNFGTMAGLAEMLIQSHEGFIELLPALPAAWKTGEFKGLMARGNFELSAKWEESKAKQFKIVSKSGGSCTIKYKSIQEAQLKDAAGNAITYSKVGPDTIAFNTKKSGEYFITF